MGTNIFGLLKDNKDKVIKVGLGLVGTAIGLMVAGCFTDEDEVDGDDCVFDVTEGGAEEVPSEGSTEEVEG